MSNIVYKLGINGGTWYDYNNETGYGKGKPVKGTREQLITFLKNQRKRDRSVETKIGHDGEQIVTIEQLVDHMISSIGHPVAVYDVNFVEMGDDYAEMALKPLKMKPRM